MLIGCQLQWHIFLHKNKLPLSHLIQHLDAKTNDSRRFSGAIGEILENCEKFSVVEVELPLIYQNDGMIKTISLIYVM